MDIRKVICLAYCVLSTTVMATDARVTQILPEPVVRDQATVDRRMDFFLKSFEKQPEVAPNGIVVFKDLRSGLFSKTPPFPDVFMYARSECETEGVRKGVLQKWSEAWPKFVDRDKDVGRFAAYLASKGVPLETAGLVAKTRLALGSSVTIRKVDIEAAIKAASGISNIGYLAEFPLKLCISQDDKYQNNIAFAIAVAGEIGRSVYTFAYIPGAFFDEYNKTVFASQTSLPDAVELQRADDVLSRQASESQKVVGYAFKADTGLVRSVRFQFTGSPTLELGITNQTRKPIVFPTKSIASAKFGDVEYGIVYKRRGGFSGILTSGSNCALANDDNGILINPGATCYISLTQIGIPGIKYDDLPNSVVGIIVLGVPITLTQVRKGQVLPR